MRNPWVGMQALRPICSAKKSPGLDPDQGRGPFSGLVVSSKQKGLTMFSRFLLVSALGVSAIAAQAQDSVVYPFDGEFDDATFAVESAIIDKGLVIDTVSHVGEMLNRTAEDVGSENQIFKQGDVYSFCSAVISREVMEDDPMNIVHCPYGIFVVDNGDGVLIGHRNYPEGAMQKVQSLLTQIVEEAVDN